MKKLAILMLFICCLSLSACSGGTTVTKTVTEEVTKVYTIEEDGTVHYEDLIPDEIEFGGNSYSLSGIEDADGDPKETKKTTKTETEETDDLILIYFDEIKAFLDKYLVLTAALMAALILGIYVIKRYRARYDLWW